MKLTSKTIFLWVSMVGLSINLQAQTFTADPEAIDELTSRTLIVEQLELDDEIIQSFDRKIAKAKKQVLIDRYSSEKEDYIRFAEQYNLLVSKAASKILNSHRSIVKKTTSEVEQLRKEGSTQYTVLSYHPYTTVGSNLHIKSLKYSRIEQAGRKLDYLLFLPVLTHRETTDVMEYGDYEIALKLMVNHLEGVKAMARNNYSLSNHAKDQSKINCAEKSKYDLIIDEKLISKKLSEESMSKAYGNMVTLTATSDLMDLIENDSDKLIALAIPLDIVVGSSPSAAAIKMTSSNINVIKCLVNAKTGRILASSGRSASAYFSAKDLKKLSSCP